MSGGGGRQRKVRSDRERRRRAERKVRARTGANPRVRWDGRNLQELVDFCDEHGGSLSGVAVVGRPGILLVQPVMLRVPRGSWLVRDVRYEADDERGWRTYV